MSAGAGMGGDGAALRLLIVDDERLARSRLRTLLAELWPDAFIDEAAHAAQALDMMGRGATDVVLMDIHMPGLDGLALARQLQRLQAPPVLVFVTAHAGHAVEAFELEAIDYLTKPVRRDRLLQSLQKIERTLSYTRSQQAKKPEIAAKTDATLLIQERGRTERLPLTEVVYCKSELKYVTVRTAARSYILDESLSDLESRYPDHFVRVHRNAIVARTALRALEAASDGVADGETWVVRLAGLDETLAVSRRQLAQVREALAQH